MFIYLITIDKVQTHRSSLCVYGNYGFKDINSYFDLLEFLQVALQINLECLQEHES